MSDENRPVNRVLLVAGWGKGREYRDYLHPPLGLYRLQAGLEEEGIACDVFDPNLSSDPYEDLKRIVESSKSELVGFSSNHYTIPYDLSMAHFLRRTLGDDLLLVGGGISNTENYEQILAYAPEGFIAVRGEGDITLPELCKKGNRVGVPGLVWMEKGKLVLGQTRRPITGERFIKALDRTRWEDIPFEKYWRFLLESHDPSIMIEKNINTIRIIVSNYCPVGCKFCSYTNFYKLAGCKGTQRVHRLPLENTIAIIERLVKSHPNAMNLFFHDDDFLASARWVKELCGLIVADERAGIIPEFVTFMAQGSVGNIVKVAESLSEARFRLIGLGIESFSPGVLGEFNKPHRPERASEAIDALFKNDIIPYANLILSSTDSETEDLVMTLIGAMNLLKRGAQVAMSLYTLAFPGAEMTRPAEQAGLVTYEDKEIAGTDLVMRMTDKILPRDRRLREILERADAYVSNLESEFFSGEGSFRSIVGPMTLIAVTNSLRESHVSLPPGYLRDIEILRQGFFEDGLR